MDRETDGHRQTEFVAAFVASTDFSASFRQSRGVCLCTYQQRIATEW